MRHLLAYNGTLIVTDGGNHRIQIVSLLDGNDHHPYHLYISYVIQSLPQLATHPPDQYYIGTCYRTFGSEGSGAGQFRVPQCVAICNERELVVADYDNHRLQFFK